MHFPLAILALVGLLVLPVASANAGKIHSEYTKLNLDEDCRFTESHELGGVATCTGYQDIPIEFSEGDLRQQMRYGTLDGSYENWESFSEFNHINETIEWRMEDGRPFATILRWFLQIEDPGMGTVTHHSRGEILVISTIGTKANPVSCVVGYVDARANRNANLLARDVADNLAREFDCRSEMPTYHGKRSEWSGTPTVQAK